MIELSHSKKTQLTDAPDGRKRFAIDASIDFLQMREDGGDWVDIDPTLDSQGIPKTVPYELTPYLNNMPGFHYKSKISGEFDVRLKEARQDSISIIPIKPKPNVKSVIKGRTITWVDYYPDVDVVLTMGNACVVLNRIIKSSSAPLEYDVEINEVEKGEAQLMPLKPAEDAEGQLIKMEEKPCVGGRTETLKLEVIEQEGEKAKPISYPIKDSTELTEQVGGDENDIYTYNGTAYPNNARVYANWGSSSIYSGLRFESVNVPNGATIDAAYISVRWYNTYDDINILIHGDDVDNSSVLEGGTLLDDRPLTDEGVNWQATLNYNNWTNSPDISAVIKEIVDREGWAANNDLTIIGKSNLADFCTFYDYQGNSAYAAKLYIEYTEGGPTYYHGLKVQGVGELALCDVGFHPLRIRKGSTTYGIELVETSDPNASAVRIKTPTGIKAIRKYT